MDWTTKLKQCSRLKRWRDWKEVATDADRWMDAGGRVHQILYTVEAFVSQVVYNFLLFVVVRAPRRAAFSACKPQDLRLRQNLDPAAHVGPRDRLFIAHCSTAVHERWLRTHFFHARRYWKIERKSCLCNHSSSFSTRMYHSGKTSPHGR